MEQNLRQKSNVLPACIIAAGFIVGAIIVTKPSMPTLISPVSAASVENQFVAQMQPSVGTRKLNVDKVNYNAKSRSYFVEYTLRGGNTDMKFLRTGCFLQSFGRATFSGSCATGDTGYADGKAVADATSVEIN